MLWGDDWLASGFTPKTSLTRVLFDANYFRTEDCLGAGAYAFVEVFVNGFSTVAFE